METLAIIKGLQNVIDFSKILSLGSVPDSGHFCADPYL
jgi:hypothetical protein